MKHVVPAIVGTGAPTQQGVRVHHLDVVKKLDAAFPGWSADRGARHGLWHPKIKKRVGLRYLHKHICSMDRGWMPQWPEWDTDMGPVQVPLDYALLHDDFPVVKLDEAPQEGQPLMQDHQTATVLRPQLKTVRTIGWAEVFYHVLATGIFFSIPELNAGWVARTFGVPMDWLASIKGPPLKQSYDLAKSKGMAR